MGEASAEGARAVTERGEGDSEVIGCVLVELVEAALQQALGAARLILDEELVERARHLDETLHE